jgi:hypothetical protein
MTGGWSGGLGERLGFGEGERAGEGDRDGTRVGDVRVLGEAEAGAAPGLVGARALGDGTDGDSTAGDGESTVDEPGDENDGVGDPAGNAVPSPHDRSSPVTGSRTESRRTIPADTSASPAAAENRATPELASCAPPVPTVSDSGRNAPEVGAV